MLGRLFTEKLLAPEDVAPSDARLSVAGPFNPGGVAARAGRLRQAMAEEVPEDDLVGFPRHTPDGELIIDRFPRSAIQGNDKRCCGIVGERGLRLGFVSHFRAYRLLEDRTLGPEIGRFMPEGTYETYGVEDPRIVFLDERCWITYVGVSPHGVVTRLASTTDFVTYERA